MENIKPYLPLYIGCNCVMVRHSYHAVHELHLRVNHPFKLTGRLLQYFIEPTTKAEIKPILRNLNSITKEERMRLSELNSSQDRIRYNAIKILWYLNERFDVFGLIEKGIAIAQQGDEDERCVATAEP